MGAFLMRKIGTLTAIAAVSLGLSGCNSKPAADNMAEPVVETVAPPENAGAADNGVATENAAMANTTVGNQAEALDGTSTPMGPGK